MITIKNLSFSYGDHQVLHNLTATINPGDVTALFGPNGVGKSTLFGCILGHLKHSGTVHIEDHLVSELSGQERARLVGYVPQHHNSAFAFTVFDLVLMGRQPHATSWLGPTDKDRAVVDNALAQLGLTSIAGQVFSTLSGGQKQLVLLARAIAQDCAYLLLDEPTASLDFGNQQAVWQAMRHLADAGKGVYVCCHDPNHVLWYTDRATVLHHGGTFGAVGDSQAALTPEVLAALYPGAGQVHNAAGRQIYLPDLGAN